MRMQCKASSPDLKTRNFVVVVEFFLDLKLKYCFLERVQNSLNSDIAFPKRKLKHFFDDACALSLSDRDGYRRLRRWSQIQPILRKMLLTTWHSMKWFHKAFLNPTVWHQCGTRCLIQMLKTFPPETLLKSLFKMRYKELSKWKQIPLPSASGSLWSAKLGDLKRSWRFENAIFIIIQSFRFPALPDMLSQCGSFRKALSSSSRKSFTRSLHGWLISEHTAE